MSLREPGRNDIILKAYGKVLGFFTEEEAVARIPFPISLFRGKERTVRYADIQRISLMQDNEDFSVYIVSNPDENGKESRCNVYAGKDLKHVIPVFDSIVSRVKAVNPDAKVFLPPAMVGRKGI